MCLECRKMSPSNSLQTMKPQPFVGLYMRMWPVKFGTRVPLTSLSNPDNRCSLLNNTSASVQGRLKVPELSMRTMQYCAPSYSLTSSTDPCPKLVFNRMPTTMSEPSPATDNASIDDASSSESSESSVAAMPANWWGNDGRATATGPRVMHLIQPCLSHGKKAGARR